MIKALRRFKSVAKERGRSARFLLVYEPAPLEEIPVATLSFDGSTWEFEYTPQYKARPDLRAVEGFKDRDRKYQSRELWPFFAVRIPDVKRTDVKRRLETDSVTSPELVDMLRMFGRRVVSSPGFELVPM